MTHLPLTFIFIQRTSGLHLQPARYLLSLDGNKFILFNLWLRLFLRNVQVKDSVLEGCFNVILFNVIAYVEGSLAASGVTLAADVLLAFALLLIFL